MKITCLSVALFLAATVLASGLPADETPEPKPPELITRTYDVAPLLVDAPDYYFALLPDMWVSPRSVCGSCGSDGHMFGSNTPERPPLAAKLKELIEKTVPSDDAWETMGGRSSITIDDSLAPCAIIKTTAAAHRQIAELLHDLIARRTQTVAITISAVELEEKYARRLAAGGPLAARSEADRKALTEATKRVCATTLLTGFRGQVLSNNILKVHTYLAEETPVVAEDAVGWQPTTGVAPNGLVARAAATVSADRKSAVLNYRLCLSRLQDNRSVPLESSPRESVARAPIELPTSLLDERAGTLTMPLETPMIVGGGLAPARLVSADAKEGDMVNLYYIVTVRLTDTSPPAEVPETKARK
jgi:hypothetical protein